MLSSRKLNWMTGAGQGSRFQCFGNRGSQRKNRLKVMKTQTIIITGASSGIGKAIAGLFLAHHYQVVINSANEANLTATFQELGNHNRLAMVAGDISNP